MPLSEHEQRLLEQIERALVDDDPKFASTVRTGDRRQKARRKLQLGALLVLVGLAGLIGGVAVPLVVLGVVGFLVMFGGVALGVLNYKTATG
ncbi:MAG: putative transrane protein, partial [Modestobacter sp.]|nr:putative transrane protein [Modestobacter sp.]